MAGEAHSLDRILSLVAIVLAPLSSILLAKMFNRREEEQRGRIADTGEEVSVFQAHLSAFALRVEQLEHMGKSKDEEIAELRILCEAAEKRADGAEAQNGKLLRENYRLREQVEELERRRP